MPARTGPFNLSSTYLRLRGDGCVEPLPADDGFWRRLSEGAFGSFHDEYLVTCHAFEADWPIWEMHPNGEEIVCLLNGAVTFILEQRGKRQAIELAESGAYLVVPKGAWHTAKTSAPARLLFITAGEGTQHREVVP